MLTLLAILIIFFLFNLSIFIHEFGHYVAARCFGMRIDTFSIGMGKAIWKRKMGKTCYQIGCLPIGGFVALPQMDPNSFLEGKTSIQARDSLPPVSPWRRIVVSLAGAAGNVALAFLLGVVVWIAGKPSTPAERNGIIGYVLTSSEAAAQGMQVGDEIIQINGHPVANWADIQTFGALNNHVSIQFRSPDGTLHHAELDTEKTEMGFRIIPGLAGMDICNVGSVIPGFPAEAAGILPGDQVMTFGGQKIYGRAHLSSVVEATGAKPSEISVLRSGHLIPLTLTPQYDPETKKMLIGIVYNPLAKMDFDAYDHPTPWAQVRSHVQNIYFMLKALTNPKTSATAAAGVGGPISIFLMFWLIAKTSLMMVVWFTGFLNINLAIINLLPIPLLDGGHILFALWEAITRRPLPVYVTNTLTNFFAVLLLLAFIVLTYRDVMNIAFFSSANKKMDRSVGIEQPAQSDFDTPKMDTPTASEE